MTQHKKVDANLSLEVKQSILKLAGVTFEPQPVGGDYVGVVANRDGCCRQYRSIKQAVHAEWFFTGWTRNSSG